MEWCFIFSGTAPQNAENSNYYYSSEVNCHYIPTATSVQQTVRKTCLLFFISLHSYFMGINTIPIKSFKILKHFLQAISITHRWNDHSWF